MQPSATSLPTADEYTRILTLRVDCELNSEGFIGGVRLSGRDQSGTKAATHVASLPRILVLARQEALGVKTTGLSMVA